MDRETVIRAQAGDQEAFTRLAAGLTPTFLATAHRILRDIFLAEDATQRAMLTSLLHGGAANPALGASHWRAWAW